MILLSLLMDNHSMPNNLFYLFAAFTVTWVIFFIYAFFVSKKRQEMRREITALYNEFIISGNYTKSE